MPRNLKLGALLPTNAEQTILNVLWAIGEGTVEQVVAKLPVKPPANYKTTQSLLRILEEKGFVKHTARGRAFVFVPRVTRQEVGARMATQLLNRAFRGSHSELVMNLLDASPVKEEELDQLEALIQQYRERKNKVGRQK